MARSKATVSIRDVAAVAGVSTATVSRVLSPPSAAYPMRAETRERVLRAIDELGYRPNDLARALLHQRTSAIGLLLPDISNPYYAAMVRGVEDAASARGYRVVLCNADRDADKITTYLDTLVKTRVDGIIIAGGSGSPRARPPQFETYRTKIVVVGRHEFDHPSVQIDNDAAARAATEHVLGLGHRRMAFVGGPEGSRTAQDRLGGYRAALRDAGVTVDGELVRHGAFDEESGYRAARSLLARSPRPTAMVCANDRMAFGVYAALADAGLAIPADVSVIGFDDVPLASYVRPTLTTVAVPTYEIGQTAMALLLDQFDDRPAGDPRMLATRLMVRDSCAPPAESVG